jgi:hypothetical protein
MATVKRSSPPPPTRKPPAPPKTTRPAPPKTASRAAPPKTASTPAATGKTGAKTPSTPIRDINTRFQDSLAKKLDQKTRSTLGRPPASATRIDQKLQQRTDEKVTATMTKRLTERLANPKAPRARPTPEKSTAQQVGEGIKTGADLAANTKDAISGANAAVKKLLDLELAKKVPPAVQAAVARIDSKSSALTALVDTINASGKPPTPRQLARISSLQRDISANAKSVANAGNEALAALGASEAYQQAQAGLAKVLNRPQVARALKGVDLLGKAADIAEAAKTAHDAYHDSVFSSRAGRALDAGLTGAVNLGANTAFGVPDLLLTIAGVDEKDRIAATVTQGSRAITSITQAFATGDTAALQRYRQQVQDGPVLLQELDAIGQRLSDTRVLDFGFSYLDSVIGTLTGDEARVRRARTLRGGG